MAADKIPSGGELFERFLHGDPQRQAVEAAIFKGLESFATTSASEIEKIVQANSIDPKSAESMHALHQTIVDQTIAMIKQGPLGDSSTAKK